MRPLTLSLNDIKGKDAEAALYAAIKKAYPTFTLTQANSTIELIQAFKAKYQENRTILRIVSDADRQVVEEFYYDRFDVAIYVKNPLFTQAELPALIEGDEEKILQAIAKKLGYDMRTQDFWIEPHQFVSIGGSVPPNFRLKTRSESPYWCGEVIVWMHR